MDDNDFHLRVMNLLEDEFPWLLDDEDSVPSGADVVQSLTNLHEVLKELVSK